MRLRPLFYAWLSLCAGLITVAVGGVRAVATVAGMLDTATADRAGIVASLVVAACFS